MVATYQDTRGQAVLERYAAGERDFGGIDLSDANLSRGDLAGVNLRYANLRRANLQRANLQLANLRHSKLDRADIRGANLRHADVRQADLRHADLRGANLGHAALSHAMLRQANLAEANLRRADLNDANLSRADLSGADLRHVDLCDADLRSAKLDYADIRDAQLRSAKLGNANLALAMLSRTSFIDVDLAALCRVQIRLVGPSTVDFRSIVRSVREPRLRTFLRATGMPEVFIEYMIDCARSLDPQQVFSLLQSTFISYGGPDEAFARKLNDALEAQGVTTFFFRDDAPPGEKLHRVMRRGVNEHDRVILICSRASLERPGVLNELEETLARESRDGGNAYLLPVRLDDYVISGWSPTNTDLAQTLRDRVIADFRDHEDLGAFRRELGKLIAVLKTRPVNPIVHT